MHRNLAFDIDVSGKNTKGQDISRIVESINWRKSFETHLEKQLYECCERKTLVAVLPELCASPRVLDIVNRVIGKKENEFPVILVVGSWHEDESIKKQTFKNRLDVLSALAPHRTILTHDKFEPFGSGKFREGHQTGKKGLSFLVTSVGPMALGICKDWYFQRPSSPATQMITHAQFTAAAPLIAICPTLSGNLKDLYDMAHTLFKSTHTVMINANACGTARKIFRDGECCMQQNKNEKNLGDVRSFIAAPADYYNMEDHNGSRVTKRENGLYIERAPCTGLPNATVKSRENPTGKPGPEKNSENTVVARLFLTHSNHAI